MKRVAANITRDNMKAAKSLASIGLDFVCIPVSHLACKDKLIKQFLASMDSLADCAEDEEFSIAENNKFIAQLEEKGDE